MKRAIWITGGGGFIGSAIARSAPSLPVRAITREDFDLNDAKAVRRRFNNDAPPAVIHCAAISTGAACQANPSLARMINIDATRHLAELAAEIPFVFFSTDLVFDGKSGDYDETSLVNPLSLYAETKVEAEYAVLQNPGHTVVRTSLNAGLSPSNARAFNEEIRNAWAAGQEIRLFTDEFRCPIPAEYTARAVWSLLAANRPGLYHLAGSQRLSRFAIGELLAAHYAHLKPRITPISLRDYKGPLRPPDTSLNSSRIQSILPFPLPRFEDWLRVADL